MRPAAFAGERIERAPGDAESLPGDDDDGDEDKQSLHAWSFRDGERVPGANLVLAGWRRHQRFIENRTTRREDQRIPAARLAQVLDRNTKAREFAFRELAGRIREISAKYEDRVFLDVQGRLAKYLLELGRVKAEAPITQDDLANRVEDGLTLPGVEALVNLARLLSTFWA